MVKEIFKKENLFFVWLALMPFLAVSPWQVFLTKPLYVGFIHFLLLSILILWQFVDDLRNREFKIQPCFWSFAAFLVVAGISLYVNWSAIDGIILDNAFGLKAPHVYNVFIYIYLMFNVMTVWLVSRMIINMEILKKGIRIVLLSTSIACIYGIVSIFLGLAGIIPKAFFYMYPRLTGTATEAQVFGDFLLLGVPLAIIYFAQKPNRYNSWVLFLLGLAFIMTFSIGAYVGLAAALLFLAWWVLRKLKAVHYKIVVFILLGVILSLGLFSIINPPYLNAMKLSKLYFWKIKEDVTYFEQTKVYPWDDKLDRLWMAQTAINQFKSNPIIGVGYGNYGYLYNAFRLKDSLPRAYIAKPHNAYLEILAETGILGFLAFYFGVGLIFFNALRKAIFLEDSSNKMVFLGIIGAMVALFVHGLSFGIFAHNPTWILLGLILGVTKLYEKK